MLQVTLGLALWLFALTSSAQSSDPCNTQRTTIEINQCGQLTLKAKDKELNDAYRELLKSLVATDRVDETDYATVKRQLTDAQRAWINYRDNDCKAKLKLHESGTIRGAVYLGCLAERTEQRTKELKQWAEQ
jgi:uncharacterized protein YecT (DUF1311 family)